MILVNGFVYGLLDSGAGLDQKGDPAPLPSQWSEPEPANIKENTRSTEGTYDGGNFTVARYTVFIDGLGFPYSRVRLTDKQGEELGEFDVQSAQKLTFVNRTKITV
jgi:hypothetical protein